MENFKINIIDGIMGCGKSTAMINYIKTQKQKYPTSKFLIIVPYLDGTKRSWKVYTWLCTYGKS